MSTVVVSPTAVERLRDELVETVGVVVHSANAVRDALEDFGATGPDFGPLSTRATTILDAQTRTTANAIIDLGNFLDAIEVADRAGMMARVPPTQTAVGLVRLDETDLGWLTSGARTQVFDHHISQLRAQIGARRDSEPSTGLADRARRRRWQDELTELEQQLAQYEALANPAHLGWAGVGAERWSSFGAFASDVSAATARAEALAPVAEPSVHPRTRAARALAAESRFAAEHPFVRAALRAGVVVTSGRLEVLLELDALVAMPLAEFLDERVFARTRHPNLDWTADGCSGPIPDQAEDACLRHDFIYRNGRMLRDQWATPATVATGVKEHADERFGDELFDAYDDDFWEKILVSEWLFGAELAVGWFGDVGAAWSPPADDAFFGGTTPPGS